MLRYDSSFESFWIVSFGIATSARKVIVQHHQGRISKWNSAISRRSSNLTSSRTNIEAEHRCVRKRSQFNVVSDNPEQARVRHCDFGAPGAIGAHVTRGLSQN